MPLTRLRPDELVAAWVDDRRTPFQLGLLCLLDDAPFRRPDGSLDLDRVRRELAPRAAGVAQLRRSLMWTHVGEGPPLWVEDPAFDVTRHLVATPLPPGADLASWASERCCVPVPRDLPLWRIDVVDGLPDGRVALVVVLHHVLTDGLGGVRLATALFDTAPGAVPPAAAPRAPTAVPSHRELVRDRRATLRAGRRADPPRGYQPRRRRPSPAAGIREVLADLRTPLSTTSLPRHVGSGRRAVTVTEGLAATRETGHVLGATINDLVLAAVTEGFRDLLAAQGQCRDGTFLRTTVPVATDASRQAVGMIVVELPVGEPDPLRRLTEISGTTAARRARLRDARGDVTDVLRLPVPLARPLLRWGRRWGSGRVNLAVSNVRGPSTPLWLAGSRVLEAVPIAPLVPRVPVAVAALSYAGSLTVTVNADAAVADLDLVATGMTRSFARYRALAAQRERVPHV